MESHLRFIGELQRRSVFKVAAAYVVTSWLLVQVASIIVPAFALPEWMMRGILIALAAGFPLACILAWGYELTSDGIRREADPDDDPEDDAALGGRDAEIVPTALRPVFGSLVLTRETLFVAVTLCVIALGALMSMYAFRSPTPPHVAVLPFRVVGSEPDAEVLAAGLVEGFTSTVTQFGQFDDRLWVVPAAEITGPMTPSAARQRFGVSLVISGSLLFDADRIRLTLDLIDAASERQLRSTRIDVERRGVLALQDEATELLAGMLRIPLTSTQRASLTRQRTSDPEAGDMYLRGRGVLRQATGTPEVDAAIGFFQRALDADSAYALAYAGLGEAYWLKYGRTEDVRWVDAALRSSRHALALDSTLAPVWITLGIIRKDQRHEDAAVDAFERALSVDPRNADAHRHLAGVYRNRGEWDRAEAAYQRAISLQPEYWKCYNALGAFYYTQGRYPDAVDQFEHGLRLAPANPMLLNNVGAAYWQMRRLADAVAIFERILALDSTRVSAQSNLATAYFYRGRYDEAAALYAKALAKSPSDHALAGALADAQRWSSGQTADAPDTYRRAISLAREHLAFRSGDPAMSSSLAQYYTRVGHLDSARVLLRQTEALVTPATADVTTAFGMGELYESLGHRDSAWTWMASALERDYGHVALAYSPWLDALRSDPRVRTVLVEAGLPAQ